MRHAHLYSLAPAALLALAACSDSASSGSPSSEPVPAAVSAPRAQRLEAGAPPVQFPTPGDFVPFECAGGAGLAADALMDGASPGSLRDLVGDALHPAFARAADETHVYFRLRVDGDPRPVSGGAGSGSEQTLATAAWNVLFDTDGNPNTYEYLLTADGNLQGSRVHFVRNSVQTPNDPRDRANDTAGDFLIDLAPASAYVRLEETLDGSLFGSSPDFFVTIAVPRVVLAHVGIDPHAPVVTFAGTSASNYSVNGDFACGSGMPGALASVAMAPALLDLQGTPEPQPDAVQTNEDTPVTTDVLANDLRLRDGPFTLSVVDAPKYGTATVASPSSVTYTPAAHFGGADAYTYRVTDAKGASSVARVIVDVTPVNDGVPAALPDSATVSSPAGAVIDVLANDTDLADGPVTVSIESPPSSGTATVRTDGRISYVPNVGFGGVEVFTYRVTDRDGESSTASVTVTVDQTDGPPVANADQLTVAEDSGPVVIDVLANDTAGLGVGKSLSIVSVTQPVHGGLVSITSGALRFLPLPDFHGVVQFSYVLSDGKGALAVGSVEVTVTPVNDAPQLLVPPQGATPQDVTLVFAQALGTAIRVEDVDADTSPITLRLIAPHGALTLASTAGLQLTTGTGTGDSQIVVRGSVPALNAALDGMLFTPAQGFFGGTSLGIQVNDEGNTGAGGPLSATVTLPITVVRVNLQPSARDDVAVLIEDSAPVFIDVLANDDPGHLGSALSLVSVTQPSQGTASIVSGVVSYAPPPDFSGITAFTYAATNGQGGSTMGRVEVTVHPVNDAPVNVVPAELVTDEDTPLPLTGLGALQVTDVDAATVEFTLTTTDGTVTLDGNLQYISGSAGAPLRSVTARGTIGAVNAALAGLLFTPDADFAGEASITLHTSDLGGTGQGGALTDEDTVRIIVRPVNDAPVLTVPAAQVTQEDNARVFSNAEGNAIAVGDVDAGNAQVRMSLVPTNGTVTLGQPSAVTVVTGVGAPDELRIGGTLADLNTALQGLQFVPTPDFFGTASLAIAVSDDGNTGSGGPRMATATITLTVTPVNDAPTAVDDVLSLPQDSTATPVDVLANDGFAPDVGETLSVVAVTQPAQGTAAFTATGVTYAPPPGFHGETAFTYTISDGNGGSATATVEVTVTRVNAPPVARPDSFTVASSSEGNVLEVMANDDSGADVGETLSVTAVGTPDVGQVTLVSGVVRYTPRRGFVGEDFFVYTLADDQGATATAIVTITVEGSGDADGDGISDEEELAQGTDPLSSDTDDDGLADDVELYVTFTDPVDDDSDDDGLLDGNEDLNGDGIIDPAAGETSPLQFDTDGDGIGDGVERGLTQPQGAHTDASRFIADADPATTTDPTRQDTDEGGIFDGVEDANQNGRLDPGETDPTDPFDDGVDSDGDGVDDATERALGLNPNDLDSDDDGVPDGLDGIMDTDGDGLIDALDPDSDGDGLNDGLELGLTLRFVMPDTDLSAQAFIEDADPTTTTNPKRADSDGDGRSDGEEDKNRNGRLDKGETDPNRHEGLPATPDPVTGPDEDDQSLTNPIELVGSGCSSTGNTGSTGNTTGSTLAVFALAFAALTQSLRRARPARAATKRRTASTAALALALVFVVPLPEARAQSADDALFLDLQHFKPGPGRRDVHSAQSASIAPHLDLSLGLHAHYAHQPIRYRLTDDGGSQTRALVDRLYSADLTGTLGLWDVAELGFAVPVNLLSVREGPSAALQPMSPGLHLGGGNVRFGPKVALLRATPTTEGPRGFALAVSMPVLLPTAKEGLLGSTGFSSRPRVLGEWSSNFLRVAANVGLNLNPRTNLANLEVGNELGYAAAVEVPLRFLRRPTALQASVTGAYGLRSPDARAVANPLEALGGVKVTALDGLELNLAAGPGIGAGYGTPVFRIYGGLRYVMPEPVRHASSHADLALQQPSNDNALAQLAEKLPLPPPPALESKAEPTTDYGTVRVEEHQLVLLEPVHFATARDLVLERSYPLLGKVALALHEHPQIRRVRIEGHTDDQGTEQTNVELSERRALRVRTHLIGLGVEPSRLEAEGFGPKRPVAPNETSEGRAQNRRVEFQILERE